MFALVLALSLMLVPAAVSASPGSSPTIDGVISTGEWDGAVVIPVASGMGTVSVIAYTDYMYVLFDVVDSGDHRDNLVSGSGNDHISTNINPTAGVLTWGFPYDLIFETSALSGGPPGGPDDGGHHWLPWNPKVNSGTIDGWATRWFPNDLQQPLPGDLASATVYSGGRRVTEWKMPLASSTAPSPGDTLKVGGAIDVGDGNSYKYPVGLDWNDPATFEDVVVPIPEPIEVDIDIKPGSDPNSINPKSKGLIPVAILGSETFDVADVDVTTLWFGKTGTEASPAHDLTDPVVYADHLEDVNSDGYMDLVSHYRTQSTDIAKGDTSATLTGQTTGGIPIAGTDSIRTVGK